MPLEALYSVQCNLSVVFDMCWAVFKSCQMRSTELLSAKEKVYE